MGSASIAEASPLRVVERHYQLALLGLVTCGFLAISTGGLLDLPTVILISGALFLRAIILAGVVRWTPPRHFDAWASVCYLLFYPVDWYFLSRDSIAATVHLLLFLCVIRLFTARSARDFRFVQTLALLQMLAATLAANLYFLPFLVCFLMFGIATLTGAEILRSGSRQPLILRMGLKSFGWRITGLTLFIAAAIGAISAGLFFVLPRSAHAVFRHIVSDRYRLPGLSNEVSLGAIGEIQQNDAPLLHVRMLGKIQPSNLKWRGMVLSRFDGKRWTQALTDNRPIRVERGFAKLSERSTAGLRWFQYEVRMNELVSDVLFFAGRPQMAAIGIPVVFGSADQGFRAPGRPSGVFSYTGYSVLEEPGASSQPLSPLELTENLRLPWTDSRIENLAADWTAGATSPEAQARAIETHLKHDFTYTLELPAKDMPDPVANFLLERKKGHCEYFASGMAVLLRMRGIPARVATGFQSGVLNPVNGWLMLRGGDAHSWVEVWLPGRGWVTFDPTPPSNAAPRPRWLEQARFYMDALEVFWGEWVVGYDFERQLQLAVHMHDSSRLAGGTWMDRLASAVSWMSAEGPKAARKSGPLVALGIAGAFLLWRIGKWAAGRTHLVRLARRGGHATDVTILYQRMLRALLRQGLVKGPAMTAGEFAASVASSPRLGRLVGDITEAYERARFGGDFAAAGRLVELVSQLEKQ
jgi:protein-glutamine gamma-glutamyltransferase